MSDTKMLQAIIDGQRAMEERLAEKIDKVSKDLQRVETKVDKANERLNIQVLQLAYLEDQPANATH